MASLLLSLFAGEPDFAQVAGDLSEEFHERLSQSGADGARRWYWRETLRNVRALAARSRTLQVVAAAGLDIVFLRSACRGFTRWLHAELATAPRVPGLQMALLTLFAATVALVLGALTSHFLQGRERLLLPAFTVFFLLQWGYFAYRYEVGPVYLRVLFFALNSLFIVNSFCIGSLGASRRVPRRRTA